MSLIPGKTKAASASYRQLSQQESLKKLRACATWDDLLAWVETTWTPELLKSVQRSTSTGRMRTVEDLHEQFRASIAGVEGTKSPTKEADIFVILPERPSASCGKRRLMLVKVVLNYETKRVLRIVC